VGAASQSLDFTEPVALMLLIVMPLIPDRDDPLWGRDQAGQGAWVNERMTGPRATMRDRAAITRFFDGLDLVEPGVVQPQRGRPEPGASTAHEVTAWCGVAVKR
jgi:hypothetical protein